MRKVTNELVGDPPMPSDTEMLAKAPKPDFFQCFLLEDQTNEYIDCREIMSFKDPNENGIMILKMKSGTEYRVRISKLWQFFYKYDLAID